MPIYEYICTDCSHDHEALQKLSDAPLLNCPACGQPALKKKISAPGFRLSGSGWYETDFKSDKQRNLADSGDKDNSKKSAEKTDSAKGSDKPVAKETKTNKDAAA
ncbi:MAG: zinc ribbon domain-containing protein [Gammaproteobacteria bacterium]|nr:zinc ribbon domain-containing protein [Gammaproteobacteria bacterium]